MGSVGPGKHRSLRKRAEALLRKSPQELRTLSPGKIDEIVHELLVHQIELEMQNDELRNAQLIIEVSRAKYTDLYDFSPAGYLTLTEKNLIRNANLTAAKLLGAERNSLMGKPFSRFIVKDDQDTFYLHLRNLSKRQSCELRMKTVDGTEFWSRLECVADTAEKSRKRQIQMVVTDISELKRTEVQLREAKNAAEEADRAKGEFLANMSHEIRTPMSIILGMHELALETALPAEADQYIRKAQRSARSLLGIINEILDFSRIEAGRMEMKKSVFDPRALVEDTVEKFAHQARQKGLEVESRIAPDVPALVSNYPERIDQVLVNLLGNALKFTPQGKVVVGLEAKKGSGGGEDRVVLRFFVTDTGPGIAPENVDLVFDSFRQIDGSLTRRHSGTGLGLAIAKRIVERLEGKLRVESRQGEGSTFSFTVPVYVVPQTQAAGLRKPEVPAVEDGRESGTDSPARSLHILLVEDDAGARELYGRIIRRRGWRITVVGDGRSAIAAVGENDFDLILMDVQMPGMDGLETTRVIRKLEVDAGGHTPIVGISAHALLKYRQMCLEAGMDGYITKPMETDTLFETILGHTDS